MEPSLSLDWSRPFVYGDSFSGEALPLINSAAEAHAGTGTALVEIGSCRSNQTAASITRVPQATPTEGPAATFWYRSTDFTGEANLSMSGGSSMTMLTPSTAWRQGTLCFPPSLAGRWASFQWNFYLPSSSCPGTDPEHALLIDDVVVDTDPSCVP